MVLIKQTKTPEATPDASDKKIIHPIFMECSELTLDPYWKQIFEECAKGKFPTGSSIDNTGSTIYIKTQKTKGNSRSFLTYKLSDNVETIFVDLKEMFQKHLLHKSKQDRLLIAEEIQDICRDLREVYNGDWKDIRKKNIKEPIIRRFILSLQEKYSLSIRETEDLTNTLDLGFSFNWIPNDAVVYKDQEIKEITILHFCEKTRTFQLEETEKAIKREYKPKVHKLSDLWDKHLKKPKNTYSL